MGLKAKQVESERGTKRERFIERDDVRGSRREIAESYESEEGLGREEA
jgi:hypothetical protein